MFTVCCNSHLGRKLECKAICKGFATLRHVPVAVTFRWIKTGLFSFLSLHFTLPLNPLEITAELRRRPGSCCLVHSVMGILESTLCADCLLGVCKPYSAPYKCGTAWFSSVSLVCCGWYSIAFVGNCLRNHTLERDKIPVVFIFLTFLKQCKK